MANTVSVTSSGRPYGGPRLTLFAGKALGEVSNLLSELSSFLALQENRHPGSENRLHLGSEGTGFSGEALFTIGGAFLVADAGKKFLKLYNSAPTPERREKLLREAVEFVKGVANTVSGATGLAGNDPNVNPIAAKISSGAWAFSELANAVMQGYKVYESEKKLDREQLVHIGQIAGSALKFAGIVVSLTPKTGMGAIAAEAAGSVGSIASGVLNLYNKGHFNWLANQLIPGRAQQQGVAAGSPA